MKYSRNKKKNRNNKIKNSVKLTKKNRLIYKLKGGSPTIEEFHPFLEETYGKRVNIFNKIYGDISKEEIVAQLENNLVEQYRLLNPSHYFEICQVSGIPIPNEYPTHKTGLETILQRNTSYRKKIHHDINNFYGEEAAQKRNMRENTSMMYIKMPSVIKGGFDFVPNDTIICFLARLDHQISVSNYYMDNEFNFCQMMEKMTPDIYKKIFKYNSSLGSVGNTGYQVFDQEVGINAFRDAAWYFPGQIYPNTEFSVNDNDFKLPPDKQIPYGSQFSLYRLEYSPGASEVVRKSDIMNYYALRSRLEYEKRTTRKNYYKKTLRELLVKGERYKKKYNLVIISSSRSLKDNKDPGLYFKLESICQTMNETYERDIRLTPPIPPDDNIPASVIHINKAFSDFVFAGKASTVKTGDRRDYYSSVIPSLLKIIDKPEYGTPFQEKDGIYLSSISIKKISLFLDNLFLKDRSKNLLFIKECLKHLFSNKAFNFKVKYILDLLKATEIPNFKFFHHPLAIESIVRNIDSVLSYKNNFRESNLPDDFRVHFELIKTFKQQSASTIENLDNYKVFDLYGKEHSFFIDVIGDKTPQDVFSKNINEVEEINVFVQDTQFKTRTLLMFPRLKKIAFHKRIILNGERQINRITSLEIGSFAIQKRAEKTTNQLQDLIFVFPRVQDLVIHRLEDMSITDIPKFRFIQSLILDKMDRIQHPIRIGGLPLLNTLYMNRCNSTEVTLRLPELLHLKISDFSRLNTIQMADSSILKEFTLANIINHDVFNLRIHKTIIEELTIDTCVFGTNFNLKTDSDIKNKILISRSMCHTKLIETCLNTTAGRVGNIIIKGCFHNIFGVGIEEIRKQIKIVED